VIFNNKFLFMRKLIMKMSFSADGFVGGANGEKDWVFKTGDPESLAWSVGTITQAGLILMGRKTFESIAPYWITATGPFAGPMNELPKAVFSKNGFKGLDLTKMEQTPAVTSWNETRIFNGDLVEGVRKLKAESGNPIVAIGGAGFMRSLVATRLIDEYQLATHPVLLGAGEAVFSDLATPRYLKLVDVKVFPAGAMVRTYHPA
jgi:dihydrofolate reductase